LQGEAHKAPVSLEIAEYLHGSVLNYAQHCKAILPLQHGPEATFLS